MPTERQVTAREFYAEALTDVRVLVPAGSFNAEWNKASVRARLKLPEFFGGKVTQYIKGTGGPSSDRWKIVYEDGDETVDDSDADSLPYCEAHGHAHPVGLMKSKEPRKTEVYKGLSAVQRDIASGAAIVSAQKEQTLPAKRR
ncbi:hypothetical protein CYMTET_28855, partial [Cymbomonas tetramitiformis]